jgi:hypothetical protein
MPAPRFNARTGHDLGDVALFEGLTARGCVVAPDGTPVSGASVWFGDVGGTTDRDGRFRIEHLGPGPWRVYAHHNVDMRNGVLHVDDIGEPVTVVVSNDLHVHLNIDFTSGSEPPDDPPYVHVTWRRSDGDPGARVHDLWLRKRYSAWVRPAQAGRWIVRVELAGWEPQEVPVDVLAGRAVEVRVTLTKSAK